MKRVAKKIEYEERKILEKLLEKKRRGEIMSIREIGRIMGRGHTTILYEIKEHSGQLGYKAEKAQMIYERKQMEKGNVCKIQKGTELAEYIEEQLKEGWSPEMMAGRIKNNEEEREKTGGKTVCHETIYEWIYSEEMRKEKLWKYLLRHREKRRKKGRRKQGAKKGGSVPNMTPITERPKEVEKKKRVGDWESDSVQFSGQKGILSVQVERKTRRVKISKCPNKTALETKKAIIDKLGGEDAEHLKTITFDRGTEGALHEEIAKELGVKIFFCDAYCSWQKGLVENRNMFIRKYLPRNTRISEVTDEEIYVIQEKLNNRPMKCLNYRTPNEQAFYEKYNRYPPLKWNGA